MHRIVLGILVASLAAAASAAEPSELDRALKERLETAKEAMAAADAMFEAGRLTFDQVPVWSRRLVEAELALAKNAKERIAALEELVKRAKAHEDITAARFAAGRAGTLEVKEMKYYRLDAEVRLETAKKQATGK